MASRRTCRLDEASPRGTRVQLMNQPYILTLILLSSSVGLPVNPESCAPGEVRNKISKSVSRCCKPWPFVCPINYPYTVCRTDGGWDSCQKCRPGFIQPNLSNTSHPMSCYRNNDECEEGKIPLQSLLRASGSRLRCICDQANNYFPLMSHDVCDFKPFGCPIGEELQLDGSCKDCLRGTYKDWAGTGPCLPWTNCESQGMRVKTCGNSAHDTVCRNASGRNAIEHVSRNTIQTNTNGTIVSSHGNNVPADETICISPVTTKRRRVERGKGQIVACKKGKGAAKRKKSKKSRPRVRKKGKGMKRKSRKRKAHSRRPKVHVKQRKGEKTKRKGGKLRRSKGRKRKRDEKRRSKGRKIEKRRHHSEKLRKRKGENKRRDGKKSRKPKLNSQKRPEF